MGIRTTWFLAGVIFASAVWLVSLRALDQSFFNAMFGIAGQ